MSERRPLTNVASFKKSSIVVGDERLMLFAPKHPFLHRRTLCVVPFKVKNRFICLLLLLLLFVC